MTVLLERPALPAAVRVAPPEDVYDVPVSQARRRTGGLRQEDVRAVLGGAAASIALTALLFEVFTPLHGILGFVVVAYLLFVLITCTLVAFTEPGPLVRERFVSLIVHSLAVVLLGVLVVVVVYTMVRAWPALHHINFFHKDLTLASSQDPLTAGGVVHGIVGTLEQITIALILVIPLGIAAAVFLTEVPGPLSRLVRTIAEAMTALPSIVAGLFIYATLIIGVTIPLVGIKLKIPKSGLAAALALSIMMLPIVIRAADVVLRLVPGNLKEASLALGAGQWRTVWHVTLPTARSGLATAVILGTARGIGETSPVLLTAGFTASTNANPTTGNQVSLPLLAFNLTGQPSDIQIQRGFGAAATLLVLVVGLFVAARALGGRGPGSLTRRQEHRRVLASQRDESRWSVRTESLVTAAVMGAGVMPGVSGSHVAGLPDVPLAEPGSPAAPGGSDVIDPDDVRPDTGDPMDPTPRSEAP